MRNGKFGVLHDSIEAVPFFHDTALSAISEWEYFERLNTSSEQHRRFLSWVTPPELIDEVVARYRNQQ